MKQVIQNMRTGKTSVEEVPIPTPRTGMALIRTCASLVSTGTERSLVEFAEKSLLGKARSRPDLVNQVMDKARREGLLGTIEAAFNRLDEPMALGYSSAGVIEALGADMPGHQVGQHVACAGGNYAVHAEYALVPRNLLALLPDGVDFELASFTTLAAIAMHGFRLAESQVGENVVVIGLGLLGLLMVQIALAAGCHVLGVDINPERVKLAKQVGAQAVLRPQAKEAALAFSTGCGADAILICAGDSTSDTVILAGMLARDHGRVVAIGAVGQDLPRALYFQKELSFVTSRSYGPGRYDPVYEEGGVDYPYGYVRWTEGRNLAACVEMIASGKLDVQSLITHRYPIERAAEAYNLITGKQAEPFLGIVLTYEDSGKHNESNHIVCTSSIIAPVAVVKLGVLGAGMFANAVMLPAIKKQKDIELVGIASAGGLHARHAGSKFGFGYATSKDRELIMDPGINTLAILTRHDSHVSLTIQALKAGKHVFVEKPLAVDASQLEELEAYLNNTSDNKVPLLMVGFNRRFAPLAKKMQSFIAGRHEPLMVHYRVNAGSLPLSHWLHDPAQGGGRIIGEGCHFIDFLTFLVGEPPNLITTHGLLDSGRYREDVLTMTFRFPDGSLGVIEYLANGDKAFTKERVEVFCAGQVAVLEDFRSLELVQNGRRKLVKSILRQDKGHFNEWQAFIAAIRTGGPPPIPYTHLFGVTRASFAAIQSLRTNQKIEIH